MGLPLDKVSFTEQDYINFHNKLKENLADLEKMLENPDFGTGDVTVGGEVEFPIVNQNLEPALINQKIIHKSKLSQLQHELNKYNLELNLSPYQIKDDGLLKMHIEMADLIEKINKTCKKFSCSIIPIGILPTLKEQHFDASVITDEPRYHALSNGIKSIRKAPFFINIHGEESLQIHLEELTVEGANTSFQVQLKVPPSELVDMYNAVQLCTPFAIALSANSPILLNKILWDETRIALFKQAVDTRNSANKTWRKPNRVSFGYGWLRESPLELFESNVALYPPLLPQIQNSIPKANGAAPALFELRMHQSSIWHWNRLIYDPIDGGHLRIEMRALPTGPTIPDMMANAAFLVGLATRIKKEVNDILPSFPFMFAEHNFYNAAKKGLGSQLLWPMNKSSLNLEHSAKNILQHLLPFMEEGLGMLNVDPQLIYNYSNLLKNRIDAAQNGATWQKAAVHFHEKNGSRDEAIHQMLKDYLFNSTQQTPVAEWLIK